MAPLPADDQNQNIDQTAGGKSNTTATIVVGAVLFIGLTFIATIIAFILRKRKLRKQLPAEHRLKSYHPFRTETTDKSSLLENAQNEERSSMFSRERGSSVSVYIDAEPELANRRVSARSMETVSLIPLHVALPDRHESLTGEISNGSGVSALSSRYSRGSISLNPIQQEGGDLGTRPVRPRRTSSSVRYYGKREGSLDSTAWKTSNPPHTSVAAHQLPEIPRIVHTLPDQ
ncbi:hypothetical protein PMIN03_007161 [Paraphaeosphaeria minitans]